MVIEMTIGIICEYNPFHNGHLYHLNKIKEMYPNSTIILVMSGNITQRGDISIIDKWDKTDIALYYGIDLVIELPFIYACNSSDIFSKGAIKILNELKINKIVFGSELNDIDILKKIANVQINNKKYDNLVKKYIGDGINYPTACGKAIYELTNININTPNDILGLSYIKEILLNKYKIDPICVKRTNDYHSVDLDNDITSATSIRKALKDHQDISKYVPNKVLYYLYNIKYLDNYYPFIKYKILSQDIDNIYEIDNHIKSRIYKYIKNSSSLEELINNIKSKNYTYSRIKRLMIYILFNITNNDINNFKDYIRILGFNNTGKQYLNNIKKDIKLPLITNYSNGKNLLNIDYKINSILCILLPKNLQKEYIEKEFKEKIRIVVDNNDDMC